MPFGPDKIASLVSEIRKAINRLKSLGTLRVMEKDTIDR
jgi:hypothetical protein